jgi:hypothetical protein
MLLVLVGCGSTTGTREEPDDTPEPETTEAPLPADPNAKVEELVRRQYEGTNNREMPFLRGVTVTPGATGLVVDVEFNANDNFGMGLIRTGIENEMEETYQTLYTSGEAIEEVFVGAYFTLIDDLGNETEELVYGTLLPGTTAAEINWDNAALVNWPDVWQVTLIHPEVEAAE